MEVAMDSSIGLYWKRRLSMDETIVFNLNNESVEFTPDGKVSVLDAIRILTNSDRPRSIWENLKTEHPEILTHCEDYPFQREAAVPVVNSEGWEKIWLLLIDYLSDPDLA
jgi:hypothetical protein